jgi:ABC-2 type transport system permease protein
MLNLLIYEVLSRRYAILGWGIGLGLLATMYILVFPAFAEQIPAFANMGLLQLFGIDMSSFASYISSFVLQLMPVLLGVYMIIAGASMIAGEDDSGTLELVVTMPLRRWQIVTVKFISLAVVSLLALILISLITALALSVVLQVVEGDVTPGQFFAANLATWPLMLAVAAISLFFSAFLPNRRSALAVTIAFYLFSYVVHSISGLADSLESLKTLSIFSYMNTSTTIFTEGVQASDAAVLLVIALTFFMLALWTFQSRNVTVGQWPWQRRMMA